MLTKRLHRSLTFVCVNVPTAHFQNKEVKENAARYLKEIVEILATVNKEMILIFKTLDLLRNISSTLGTQQRFLSSAIDFCSLAYT
jgi:aarF domain-containing kinase